MSELGFGISLTGDWQRAIQMLERMPLEISVATKEEARTEANNILSELKGAIEEQTLSLVPLSPDYLARKMSEGLDSRILIATGEYVDKLRYEEIEFDNEYEILVGAFDSDIHESSGLTMEQLAMYLEEGTARMPARPHFEPVWEKIRGSVLKQFAQAIKNAMLSL